MRTVAAWIIAATVAVAGTAMAGEGCPYMKGACAGHASCAGKTAAACPAGMTAGCPGCAELSASGKALRDAGAKVEVVKTQTGYVVLATSADADTVAKLRKLSADRWAGFKALAENPKLCKSCSSFEGALASKNVTVDQLEISNGVMTVFTGLTPEAVAALKASCASWCGTTTASAEPAKDKATI